MCMLYVCVCFTCHGAWVVIRGLLVRAGSPLPSCGFWGLNLGHQVWQQVSLCTESFARLAGRSHRISHLLLFSLRSVFLQDSVALRIWVLITQYGLTEPNQTVRAESCGKFLGFYHRSWDRMTFDERVSLGRMYLSLQKSVVQRKVKVACLSSTALWHRAEYQLKP